MTADQQRTFAPTFTAIYRADITEAVGQVVGPNTMGELFRLDHVEDLGDGRWRGHFEIATSAEVDAYVAQLAGTSADPASSPDDVPLIPEGASDGQ